MKIFADIYLYNTKKEDILYNINTSLSTILKDADEFIKIVYKEKEYENLVIKWSELNNIFNKYGDIPLFKLLRLQKKFKICYGGYIKFRVTYNTKELINLFVNNKIANNETMDKFFLVYKYILKYLTNEDIINLSLINKMSYSVLLSNKLFDLNIHIKNSCYDNDEELKKYMNFNKFFGVGLYEVKKLGCFLGDKYIYLLIQSIETYNVEIMKLNKDNIDEHEIIFRDCWTNYYMINNNIFQIKFTKEKIKLNKIDKNDEINFISINASNLGDDFDSEYFYYYTETKDIFLITSELKMYKYNKGKKKLKLFLDESKKYKKFKLFVSKCKIRTYWKYYKFIKDKFFLSLNKFYIYDILKKAEIIAFPEIRGVENVQKINKYYYIIDYRFEYLLNEKDFEINFKFKKYHNDLCCNCLLRIDPFLNLMQITPNDYISRVNNININEEKNIRYNYDIKLNNLYIKFNDKYLCSDYYNDKEALYIKLYDIIQNRYNNNDYNLIKSKKTIRISMNKFIKNIKFEKDIKEKFKKEIINNIKCHLYFNELGDFIININEYFWIYQHIDNCINNNINNNDIEEPLNKYNKIMIKSNDIIRFHNIIFYDKVLIIWKHKSLKILYYYLNTNDIKLKDASKEEKNKINRNVKILSLANLKNNIKDIDIKIPLFLFHSDHKLFLITNFSEENKSYELLELLIKEDKIILIDNFQIKIDGKLKTLNDDEYFIFAKFILNQKYLVIFTSSSIYLFYENKKNTYEEIKRKEHSIVGYFQVRQLLDKETCFIVQDDRIKDCLFFDISLWIQK